MLTGKEILDQLSAEGISVLAYLNENQARPFSTRSICRYVLNMTDSGAMRKCRAVLSKLEKHGLISASKYRGPGVSVMDWKITAKGKMLIRGADF